MAVRMKTFPCERCYFRRRAEADPNSLLARFWRWHTRWCPGWKAYQLELARREAEAADNLG
ncbi:hypothetical protein [Desulfocurvibacter africanus]|uniref:Uncharacterized protein n=1 Tax=Desulfocurvibacter africanus subsp. africanus str. Walvis Bay TaxID=690850 RepID=F3YV46_DESAF|nr:hypothetical protein [Desulfocurvibacter africanus]EGJ49296.1 hypothetical protein Desaf_0948 [Desulfocurvibacter africanus subsp. africanus str. Walvis Bay]